MYVNSLIDGPLKITFVGDMVTIKNTAFIMSVSSNIGVLDSPCIHYIYVI